MGEYTSFLCSSCGTEIQATPDMIGQEAECPACGAKLVVPAPAENDGVKRHATNDVDLKRTQAMKSRTIRIELPDL